MPSFLCVCGRNSKACIKIRANRWIRVLLLLKSQTRSNFRDLGAKSLSPTIQPAAGGIARGPRGISAPADRVASFGTCSSVSRRLAFRDHPRVFAIWPPGPSAFIPFSPLLSHANCSLTPRLVPKLPLPPTRLQRLSAPGIAGCPPKP
jgi:hypothetical protein